jgi:hypothetical protein
MATPATVVEFVPTAESSNGSAWDIYIRIASGAYELFTKDAGTPGDWDTGNRSNRSFLKNHQESYDGRKATSLDPDFDGVSTLDENKCGLSPIDNDTDDDGILDGQEIRLPSPGPGTDPSVFRGDANPKTATDPKAADTDGDGLRRERGRN